MIGAGYSLWLAKRVIWGDVGNAHVAELKDINMREWIVLGVCAAGVLLIGIWPKPLTDLMEPSLAQLAAQLAASKVGRNACWDHRNASAGTGTRRHRVAGTTAGAIGQDKRREQKGYE